MGPTSSQLSPNLIEQIKFQSFCLRKIGQFTDLSQSPIIPDGKFEELIDYHITLFKRSEIDPVFRKYLLPNLPGMLKKVQPEFKLAKAEGLIASMIDIDNTDI